MSDNEEPKEYPMEGSDEWKARVQATILAPSPFKWVRELEHDDFRFSIQVQDMEFEIVPMWDEEEARFNQYDIQEVEDNYPFDDREVCFSTLDAAQEAVESIILEDIWGSITDAFHSFEEGLRCLSKMNKETEARMREEDA